jgi:EAL domain-containing protein (putative c-di-GMP-specific phosphodiesterase class I)
MRMADFGEPRRTLRGTFAAEYRAHFARVETEAALAALEQIGVDFAQGYWIGRPTPLADPT